MARLARQWRSGGALLLHAVEAMEMKIGLASWSGRRVGGSCCGQQRQDGHGTWQRGQAAGDECHPRGTHFLNWVRYYSSPFS